ncbi:ATP-binding protein [Vibrio campbellii]|uniref:ATP-binding protein n=1 Tax=Vibrio campbellii TaxID=680 RepID=A0ABY5IAP9_9VIBR|nr:ATP-binding protein [Vibrio campbellii]UTZ30816.1 ATP-binding protein [Vibrio campbellii]
MNLMVRILMLFGLALSHPAFAEWEYDFQPEPKILPVATEITEEINKLPEPLFMSDQDKRKVNQLLNAVISEQRKQTLVFDQHLKAYRKSGEDNEWFETQSSYLTLNNLSQSKERLLEVTDPITHDKMTGFGPYGVTQFKQEWRQTQLNVEYLLFFQIRAFKSLIKEIMISPIPVIWAGTKVLFIYLGLFWWLANSKRIITLFRETQLDNVAKPPIWVRLIWYISRAHRSIAWLIAITLSLRVLSQIPSLQHLTILEIFTWWVLGGSIAISFLLEFAYRNSRSTSKEVIALRLSTIRRYVWSAIVAGVILQISIRTLGKGTIYSWICSAVFFWFVLVTLSVLRMWRKKVFEAAEKLSDRPVSVNWSLRRKDTFLLSIIGTAICAVWIMLHNFKHRVVAMLSNYTMFSQALAYLFRIEFAKQTGNKGGDTNLARIKGEQAFQYILPGSEESEVVEYAGEEIKLLSKHLLTDSPAVCVLSGERGVGTTTFLRTILSKVKNAKPIYINCPYSGYSELLQELALQIGLEGEVSEIQVLSALRKSDTSYLIAVDNAQRLVKPMVGGLGGLIKLTNLLRRSRRNHRVVMAIEKASWRFVDRARGERLLFDWVVFMPRWNEKQLSALFDTRINQEIENPVTFDGLVVPKQWDQEDITEEERAKQGFYRILWHYSDGNPTVALRFFRLSLRQNKETQQVVVRLFHAPESQELEKMPKPMLAVLRSIVQLEVASPEELSECTQLSIAEVIGTLRYFQSRGFIEWSEDKARVSDHWFRHITNVLDRQHLLVK